MAQLNINGVDIETTATLDTPLLYVLSDELQLKGPRFGCGLAQCGSCSVLVDGVETRACVTPISGLANKAITTLEGITTFYAAETGQQEVPQSTPLQDALIEEQALQCGYCYNGMIIKGTELLLENANPSEAEVRSAMNGHLCRCGTYPKIISAILKASETMQSTSASSSIKEENA